MSDFGYLEGSVESGTFGISSAPKDANVSDGVYHGAYAGARTMGASGGDSESAVVAFRVCGFGAASEGFYAA